MTNQKRILPSILLSLMLVMTAFCTACSDVEQTSYKTLLVAAHTYDATMKSLASAEHQKLITTEQYEKAKDIGHLYHAAFHTSCVALESYVRLSVTSAEDEATLLENIATMTVYLTELTTYASELGVAVDNLSE